jgi:G3E family GTPase
MANKPVPVTILTGFLGAGKTTLLNYILREEHGYKFAVIVNEIGEIGIDGALVENQQEEIVQLNNGCVCCTIRKDLVKGVQSLFQKSTFDYLLVETTGIADPGPVAQTFLNIPALQQYARLDAIVTVVDAEQIASQIHEHETARDQVALADFLLLNKTDLVPADRVAEAERAMRNLNPHATIFRTEQGRADLKQLLDLHAFRVDRQLTVDPGFLDELRQRNGHDYVSFSFAFDQPFQIDAIEAFIQELSTREKVYRSKGFLSLAGNPRRAVFHGVNNRFTMFWDRLWDKGEPRQSQLVFIGRNLDGKRIERDLRSCLA